jgi:hypothetical protein
VEPVEYQSPDPAVVLAFRWQDQTGHVLVHYGVTTDPAAAGFGLVAGGGFDPERFCGFPVIRAEVEFGPDSYYAVFGWLQIISRTTSAAGEATTEVDRPPMFAGLDLPLAGFGYLPVMFDAPANPHHPDGDWVAETFLVAVPDIARSRRLTALTGFRWGYRLHGGIPTTLPASAIGPERWAAHQPMLAQAHPNWSFLDSAW